MKLAQEIKTLIKDKEIKSLFRKGLEKESLRAKADSSIAKSPHPKELGAKLTHPYVTTDYSESLLEFVTPVFETSEEVISFLKDLHKFTYELLPNDEFIWNASMPTKLNGDADVKIADFGKSNIGKLKSLYRMGLGSRYGRTMQSIAGIHYNLSFRDEWLLKLKPDDLSDDEFRSKIYFHVIRNFKRYAWFLVYLFGSTPVVDESFLKGKEHDLFELTPHTFGGPYSTCLRMGKIGYTSSAQELIHVSYDSLPQYLAKLEKARLTPYPPYEKIGVKVEGEYRQLNTNILQIDNEFYSNIRPKRVARSKQSALQALEEKGVQYLEIRLLDINPLLPVGIDEETLNFIDLFMLYLLLLPSSNITDEENDLLNENMALVVSCGRNPEVRLKNGRNLKENVLEIFSLMEEELNFFTKKNDSLLLLNKMKKKVLEDKNLNSDILLSEIKKDNISYTDFIKKISLSHKEYFKNHGPKKLTKDHFRELALKSIKDLEILEKSDTLSFDNFLIKYFKGIKLKKC